MKKFNIRLKQATWNNTAQTFKDKYINFAICVFIDNNWYVIIKK